MYLSLPNRCIVITKRRKSLSLGIISTLIRVSVCDIVASSGLAPAKMDQMFFDILNCYHQRTDLIVLIGSRQCNSRVNLVETIYQGGTNTVSAYTAIFTVQYSQEEKEVGLEARLKEVSIK